MFTFSKKLL